MSALLAVDLGVRVGLACYGEDGRLRWYRSRDLGDAARLRRAIPALLADPEDLTRVVIEGAGPLLEGWDDEAARRDVLLQLARPGDWRALLLPGVVSRREAKQEARALARRVVAWSGLRAPSSLDHDAAEAIAIGLWGVMSAGWLKQIPGAIDR
jgi:hypothetical protein